MDNHRTEQEGSPPDQQRKQSPLDHHECHHDDHDNNETGSVIANN